MVNPCVFREASKSESQMPKKGIVVGHRGGVDQTSQRHLNTFTDKENVPTGRLLGATRGERQGGGTNYRELNRVESQQC